MKGGGRGRGKKKKKKEMKEKTIFLDSVVRLVGLGTHSNLGPRLLITREYRGGGGGVEVRAC